MDTGKGVLVCVMIAIYIYTVNDIYGHVVEGTQLGDTLDRGGFRILCKRGPEFCACTKFGFLINYSYYITTLPFLVSR